MHTKQGASGRPLLKGSISYGGVEFPERSQLGGELGVKWAHTRARGQGSLMDGLGMGVGGGMVFPAFAF